MGESWCPYPDKRRYFSRQEADANAAHLNQQERTAKRAYKCEGHWHLATKTKNRRKK